MNTYFSKKIVVGLGCVALSISMLFGHQHSLQIPAESRSAVQMQEAASAFLNSLNQTQLDALLFDFNNDEKRSTWHNAPASSVERIGLPLSRFSISQRVLLHDLLIASTSSQGYHKIWGAVRGDDELIYEGHNREITNQKDATKNNNIGAANFWLAFFGNPRNDANWGWMLTGHHLAANFTVVDGQVAFTPLFYGSDPGYIGRAGHAGHRFLPQERERGFEFLESLDRRQRSTAVISNKAPLDDIGNVVDFLGPGAKGQPVSFRGIRGDQLTPVQQKLLTVLIEEYVYNMDFDIAEAKMQEIMSDGFNQIYFLWMGPTNGDERIFYRIHSPSIIIDFVDQRTIFDWNTHPHIIIRDPKNDYGEKWLNRTFVERADED